MSASTVNDTVRDYIAAVERHLDDLPADDRSELLEDVEEHLTEVAAEDEGTLIERLGAPEAYAAELRASAGLPPYVAPDELTGAERMRRRVLASPVGTFLDLAPVRAVRAFLPELRPGWWVLRGYLVAMILDAAIFAPKPGRGSVWPNIDGSTLGGSVLVAICVVASVWIGRLTSRTTRGRALVLAANAAIVLLFFPALPRVQLGEATFRMVDAGPVGVGVLQHGDGSPITQICAYGKDATLLKNVWLYDQDGRPIEMTDTSPGLLMDKIEGGFAVGPRTIERGKIERIGPGAIRPGIEKKLLEQKMTAAASTCPQRADEFPPNVKQSLIEPNLPPGVPQPMVP